MTRFFRTIVLALLAALTVAVAPAGAQEPRRGGIATYYLYGDPTTLDIHSGSVIIHQQSVSGVYSSLLQWDPENPSRVIPDLALRWEVTPDHLAYTFHLRQGVRWHDGKPFTAADVKATYDRLIDPNFRSPRCGAFVKPLVAGVETVDDFTVRIRLKGPATTFIPIVASSWCRIVAKHILQRDKNLDKPDSQVGTGPYKFKRYERGSLVEWERNPDYYDRRYPFLDGVKHFVLSGKARQVAAAKAGQIMLAQSWPLFSTDMAKAVKEARGDEVEITPQSINNVSMALINTARPPFDNPEMRRALRLAADRQDTFNKIYGGIGVPCVLLDPAIFGKYALPLEEVNAVPGCRQPKDEDLAEASRIVKKYYPDGVDIKVMTRVLGEAVDRSQLLIAQLRKVGIRGTLKTYESAAGMAAYRRLDEYNLVGFQDIGNSLPDPSAPFGLLFHSTANFNVGHWKNARVDHLIDEGIREADVEKRIAIYHELQRYLLKEDGPGIILGAAYAWNFRDVRLQNFQPGPTMFDNNTFMKVWLKE